MDGWRVLGVEKLMESLVSGASKSEKRITLIKGYARPPTRAWIESARATYTERILSHTMATITADLRPGKKMLVFGLPWSAAAVARPAWQASFTSTSVWRCLAGLPSSSHPTTLSRRAAAFASRARPGEELLLLGQPWSAAAAARQAGRASFTSTSVWRCLAG